jgi:phosphatidylglycerophosphatase A
LEANTKSFKHYAVEIFVTGLGSGHSPILSGTCGTIAAAIIFYFALRVWPWLGQPWFMISLVIVLFILGTIASNLALKWKIFGENQDPGKIVIDEFVGYYVALISLPLSSEFEILASMGIAFIWFRFFDILKPPPVSTAERFHGGLGIMLDDVVAGVLAMGTCRAILHYYYSALA